VTDAASAAALVEEACRRSALVWVAPPGERARAAWHVWHDGAAHLVTGGLEQDLPGMARAAAESAVVDVTVRSKDKGGRLVSWRARATQVTPGSDRWASVVPELHAKRLNAPDGEAQPERWARESIVVRLDPTGELTESPGAMSDSSHAAPPAPTPATTAPPFRAGRRARAARSGKRKA
jgi:hypothetical protein